MSHTSVEWFLTCLTKVRRSTERNFFLEKIKCQTLRSKSEIREWNEFWYLKFVYIIVRLPWLALLFCLCLTIQSKSVLFWFQGRPRAQRKSHESLVIEKAFGGKIPGCWDWLCILLSPLNGREFSSPSSKRTGILEVRVKFFEALCYKGKRSD